MVLLLGSDRNGSAQDCALLKTVTILIGNQIVVKAFRHVLSKIPVMLAVNQYWE
jgi:hypothetical protein